MNQLRHMSVFAHIVETGSITAAADSLELSKSVISQHLKALEQELGITLLKRTTRRQVLTSAGKDFYEHCKSLNQIADQAWQQARNVLEVPQGQIRITAPNALMETLVTPAIADIMKEHPLLHPELISSDSHLDLMTENIDLAIRVGQSLDSNIKQRRIGEFKDVLCSSNAKQARENIDQTPYIANSWQGRKIHHEFKTEGAKKQESILYSTEASCITNSLATCFNLITSGAGMGLIPEFILNSKSSNLQPIFPGYQLPLNTVYALHTFDTQLPLNVQLCLTAIEQQLKEKMSHLKTR